MGKPRDSSHQANALLVAPKRPFSVLSISNISISNISITTEAAGEEGEEGGGLQEFGRGKGAVFGAKVSVFWRETTRGERGTKEETNDDLREQVNAAYPRPV